MFYGASSFQREYEAQNSPNSSQIPQFIRPCSVSELNYSTPNRLFFFLFSGLSLLYVNLYLDCQHIEALKGKKKKYSVHVQLLCVKWVISVRAVAHKRAWKLFPKTNQYLYHHVLLAEDSVSFSVVIHQFQQAVVRLCIDVEIFLSTKLPAETIWLCEPPAASF